MSTNVERIFCVERALHLPDDSCRTGALHNEVYHGRACRPVTDSLVFSDSPLPSHLGVTNSNREPLQITRSGGFVPHVFIPQHGSMVVSSEVSDKLQQIPNIETLPVQFDRLVNLPMPSLGDMSWYDRKKRRYRHPRCRKAKVETGGHGR